MKKLFIRISTLTCASLTCMAASAFAAGFTDVPSASSYLPYIEDLQARGITDGIAEGLFGPDKPLTRAQLAKFVTAAFRLQDAGGTVPFTDIQDHWAANAIRIAYQSGIVDGTSDTAFSPDRPVKREEAAVMVWRYAKKLGLLPGRMPNFDVQADPWAAEGVGGVIEHGWYGEEVKQNAGARSYRPQDAITRQEMAAMLDLAVKELTGKTSKPPASGHPTVKATWLWNSSSLLPDKSTVFQFLQRQGINLVYLQIDSDISAKQYGDFIAEAGSLGIEVQALGGAPNWILPENQGKMYKLIDWVTNYNNSVPEGEKFKGIHLDVEPFTMPIWNQDPDKMLGLWRDTISGFVKQVKISLPGAVAGADLPFWLEKFHVPDGHGGRTDLSKWMIGELDQITLMAYRDNSADILSSVSSEMDEADQIGKPIVIAVETKPSSEGPITFYNKGQSLMFQELGKVVGQLHGRSSFAGYAIHEYASWINLKE